MAQGIAAVKRRADVLAADIMPAVKQLQESGRRARTPSLRA
jgi:hypothetical protein